jgi:hypothetical protein
MNQDIKKEWIEALKSDSYIQGKFALKKIREDDVLRHCCLGVLCELYINKNLDGDCKWNKERDNDVTRFIVESSTDRSSHSLPENIRQWAGITHPIQSRLININDELNLSFNEIADYIESL